MSASRRTESVEPLSVLLIGGTGFLSGHTAAALQAAGHDVTALSRGSRAAREGVTHVEVDRTDGEALARVLEGRKFDFTVDFTAFSAQDVERLLLIPYAALGRYVMISSGQVYLVTEDAREPCAEEASQGELMPEPEPGTADHDQWAYGIGKRQAEGALFVLRESYGVRATALRLPIIQGEGDGSLRLWGYLERLLDGRPIVLPDGGERLLRHVYVKDVANAIVTLASLETTSEPVYNLAQPDVVTLREFLEAAADIAGVKPPMVDASWDEIADAGIEPAFSPYAGKWSSLVDPARAAEWGFFGTRLSDYLPRVVQWHIMKKPASSHAGYAFREQEVALANKLRGVRA